MKLLGIDAGLTAPGFAVVESDGTSFGQAIFYECFVPKHLKKAKSKTLNDVHRIYQIVLRIQEHYQKYAPDMVIVELPTGGAKSSSAIKGMAFSTAMTSAALALIAPREKVKFITPNENRKGALGLAKLPRGETSKYDMVTAARNLWPDLVLPTKTKGKNKGNLDAALCWAIADALGCVATYLRPYVALATSNVAFS